MKRFIVMAVMVFSASALAGVNRVSENLERSLVSSAIELNAMKQDSDEIVKAYFATSASTLVGAAASEDPVTVGSKLSKTKFIAGITVAQQLQNLFTNQVVSANDYLSSVHNLINGSAAAPSALSQDVEVIGNKLVLLGTKSLSIQKSCQNILAAYNSSELAAALVPVSLNTIVFGAGMTKQLFVDGMNLCQQLMNFYGNSSVTQGDWISVVSKLVQSP